MISNTYDELKREHYPKREARRSKEWRLRWECRHVFLTALILHSVCVCARARVRVCVRAYVRACVCACVCEGGRGGEKSYRPRSRPADWAVWVKKTTHT